jgi:hypothetical protein
MEQSAVVKMLEAMLATLVEQVTAAVTLQLDTLIGARFADARAELEETVAARIAVDEDALDDRITTWAENNLDVESQIDRYMSHHFDLDDFDISTRIQDVLDEIDWKEKVSEVMSEARITFE